MSELDINKRIIQKIGGIGSILGVLFIIAGSLLVPRTNDVSNIQQMQVAFGSDPSLLQLSALFMIFGFWGLFLGVFGLKESMNGISTIWARLGFYFNLMGTTIWTVGMSLDISYPAAIVNWLSASESQKQIAYSIVSVLSPLGFGRGLFPIEVITLWLSYILISIGMIYNKSRSLWQDILGLLIGVSGLILGVCMIFTGREKLLIFYIVIMIFVLLWFFLNGEWMIKKANEMKAER